MQVFAGVVMGIKNAGLNSSFIVRKISSGIGVERTDEIIDEMKSDDYEHLIQTFDKYFGMIIDLER